MKITGVKTYMHFSVWRNIIFVVVDTDEGISGIGEATIRNKEMAVKETIEHHLAPVLIGMSPFEIEKFFHTTFTRDPWRNGAVFNTAISGIEMAMWDIIGKHLKVPVYNLLGGKMRDTIPLYANTWFMDAKTCDDFARDAKAVVGRGFKAIKWDPLKAAPDNAGERVKVETGLACLKAVREAVGDGIELLIELHGSLSFDGGLAFARGAEQYRPMFLEEPMHPDDFAGYRKLAALSPLPIAAGERSFTRFAYRALLEEGFLSVVQPDLSHCGGILETKKIAAAAETYFMKFAPHNSSGPVVTMASAMVDATAPNFLIQEFSVENFDIKERFFKKSFTVKDGAIVLDDTPGLGFEPDMDAIRNENYVRFQTY
ncbi:mandelate racemase/muconate lactonizing enzyme family protein [Breznakiella homolactica]|uniref:Mandelate racemase/muconate lactonizing enzyme family protein n=1 Tax=Breznakiella homolactica TaxID=2798577 RepID=A0A7T7XQQ0_9SPIR|nr:mandelate racemase/muconate lactonizing enzyme family protein [Breznakiella homolactica]QQO10735.1 mandelate racemase/muconate lactonizing enzyme family protein [Breznakiella homolactica]